MTLVLAIPQVKIDLPDPNDSDTAATDNLLASAWATPNSSEKSGTSSNRDISMNSDQGTLAENGKTGQPFGPPDSGNIEGKPVDMIWFVAEQTSLLQ